MYIFLSNREKYSIHKSVHLGNCSIIFRRMNVALTRAKNHLVIVGNKSNLNGNRLWSKVIGHCSGMYQVHPHTLEDFCRRKYQIDKSWIF